MLHEDFLKEINALVDKRPASIAVETDSNEVAGGVLQDQEVAGPSKGEEEASSSKSEVLPSTMIGIATANEMKKYQLDDQDIRAVLQVKASGIRPSSQEMVTKSPACSHYWVLWDGLVLVDGILYKRFTKKDGKGNYLQLLIPSALKRDILCQMHSSLLSGHLGSKKTKQKTLQRYYWYALKEDVNLHILKYDVCQADKKQTKIPRASLGTLPAGAPGDCLATDYLGP